MSNDTGPDHNRAPATHHQFGAFGGVFTPAILTILGVIMFMRAGFVVGQAGIKQALLILLIAKSITFLTALSIAAVSTNTEVKGGGSYFLISRSLGPEFGGTIGLTLWAAQALAVPFYILGFAESVVQTIPALAPHFLTLTLIVAAALFVLTYVGADWAIRVEFFVLGILVIAIAAFLLGSALHFSPAQFHANFHPEYLPGLSFWAVFAIYFPAVTGIDAGLNMSGDLKDPAKSMPLGTLSAVVVGAVIYGAQILLCGGAAPRAELVETPFKMLVGQAPLGVGFLVVAGVFAATLSSAIGSFVGGPRILQALARDRIFPVLRPLGVGSRKGDEPRRALVLTGVIVFGVLYLCGNDPTGGPFNVVAAVITMFFLYSYGMINLAAFTEAYTKNPSFRPRFRLFHYFTGLLGAIGCGMAALLINPLAAVAAMCILGLIYGYVRHAELTVRFGDARRGFYYHTAGLFVRGRRPAGVSWRGLTPLEAPTCLGARTVSTMPHTLTRRDALRTLALSAAASSAGGRSAAAQETRMKPNLVVFLVDDMGWQDTSVPFHTAHTPFNDRYRTPNMERLADEGMKFTQAYACSVCSPTRVSLMTGLNAARHRVTNWTLHKNASNDRPHDRLEFPQWHVNGISPDAATERATHVKALPAFLREGGYRTIHCGKAHFGAVGTPGAEPRNFGFDVNIGGHAAGGPGSYLGTQNFSAAWRDGGHGWDVPGLDKYHGQDIFLTEALTREALAEVDRAVADGIPFYLYMSHYAVHVPFAEDKRFLQRYVAAGLDRTEAQYAALLEGMDKSLGDLLQRLDRHGIADNTIVLFMSDNGGLSAHGRGGAPHTHNKPLSSGKGSAHEGGTRVPMLARWPGITQPGSICNDPLLIEDYFPTLLALAGVEKCEQLGGIVDGVTFEPLLRHAGATPTDRAFCWHYPNNWGPTGPGIGPSSAVRVGDWKLVYYHVDRSYELFNLADDLGEQRNLATDQPTRVGHLAEVLRNHLLDCRADMPIDKQTGDRAPLPG